MGIELFHLHMHLSLFLVRREVELHLWHHSPLLLEPVEDHNECGQPCGREGLGQCSVLCSLWSTTALLRKVIEPVPWISLYVRDSPFRDDGVERGDWDHSGPNGDPGSRVPMGHWAQKVSNC